MKKTTVGILAAIAAVGFAGTASAQVAGPTTPFSLEVRGGLALPVGEDMDGLETGFTVGANAMFQVTPMFGIYAGYDFNSFAVDEDAFEGEIDGDVDVNAELKGLRAGVRANLPFGTVGASPYVFGGLLYQSLGLSVSDGESEFSGSGDEELGFEVGGGVEIPLGNRLSFTPAASYNKVEDATWVKVDVGIKIRL